MLILGTKKKNTTQIDEKHVDTTKVSEKLTFLLLIPKWYHDNMPNDEFSP